MSVIEQILEKAQAAPRHIVLPEGEDPRVLAAAVRAVQNGIAKITLLGTDQVIERTLRKHSGIEKISSICPLASQRYKTGNPLEFANRMVKDGDADGSLAGACHDTRRVIRSAYKNIALASGTRSISSLFLMVLPDDHPNLRGGFIFSDCALVVDPNAKELANIASSSVDTAKALLSVEPRVAMLSFSTYGSAKHGKVEKVRQATKILRGMRPDLIVDGELQFDAAMMPEIAQQKAPNSSIAGSANIFIFINL